MRNRRNTRKRNNVIKILANKNFIIIICILISIILLSIGLIEYRRYQDKLVLANQKRELEQQKENIFSSLDETIENINNTETDRVASISAVGDILCGEDMLKDANNIDGYDFSNMFKEVVKYTQKSDISIGTLETNIVNNKYSGIGKYNSPTEFLKAIKESGIDIVSIAHNHELDYGVDGLNETIKKIQDEGLSVTGIKENTENADQKFTGNIKEVNKIKIAFLSYTYGINNETEISEEEKEYANIYNEEKVLYDIEYAKKKSNFIIVIMHWGEVNNSNVSNWQENVKNYLVENGVDMILGSHPSVIEPMEIIQNSEGRNVLVAYSLGNYISSFKYENADVELILNIQIYKKAGEEKAILRKVDYTPIYVLDNGKNAENRFELTDMKQLAIDYANGDTSRIDRKTYNKLIEKIEWLSNVVNK